MNLKDHDWRIYKDVREGLLTLALLYTVFPACGAFASFVTGESIVAGAAACVVMVTLIAGLMVCYEFLKSTPCTRRPWLIVMGTPVVCRQPVQNWWHLNRDEDPVWQWLWDSGIYDADVHQEADQRTFVFRRRSHAVMFKLVWGGR